MTAVGRASAVLVAVLILAGCQQLQQLTGPDTIVPAGIHSPHTPAEMTQRMLDDIAADEKLLGRSLAPARIIRVQLLRQDELYEFKRFDGTNPNGIGASPDGGPGWMVEAVGTFFSTDPRTGRIDNIGTHGFHLWADQGSESFGFYPCWTAQNLRPEDMEGVCPPPGA